jgi:SAM-dependent methyltransferase
MNDVPVSPDRFQQAYSGTPPWDIGRPQGAIVRLAELGEHALFFAARGLDVWGVDLVGAAIAKAQEKARVRGETHAVFQVGDALNLDPLGRTFRTAIDSGVFHVFSDEDRARYVASLARALEPGGTYVALVFSDCEPTEWGGPRRRRSPSGGGR